MDFQTKSEENATCLIEPKCGSAKVSKPNKNQAKTILFNCTYFKKLINLCKSLQKPIEEDVAKMLNKNIAKHLKIRLTITETNGTAYGKIVKRRLTSGDHIITNANNLDTVIFILLNSITAESEMIPANESILLLHSAMLTMIPCEIVKLPDAERNKSANLFYFES